MRDYLLDEIWELLISEEVDITFEREQLEEEMSSEVGILWFADYEDSIDFFGDLYDDLLEADEFVLYPDYIEQLEQAVATDYEVYILGEGLLCIHKILLK